jgi:Double zinc ribbon
LDSSTFDAAEPLVAKVADIVDSVLTAQKLANLRQALQELGKAVGPRYSASLTVIVDVVDSVREKALPLLTTGLCTREDGPPYRTWDDPTTQRYVVNGEIQVVPHDHCPHCWEIWDFKFLNRTCQHCGTTLGQGCKVLLDPDVCPNCERGNVSATKPVCDNCGYQVDPSLVTWG